MYLPARFKNENSEQTFELIRNYPLATVISVNDSSPLISHLPLVIERESFAAKGPTSADSSTFTLIGHLARANPHSRLLDSQTVTAIFHGPQAYITPRWYAENDVPTWNYAVVHAVGTVTLIEDDAGIVDALKALTAHVERTRQSTSTEATEPHSEAWDFWLPPDLQAAPDSNARSPLASAIVAFRIDVTQVQTKFKLSQNRSVLDRQGVIKGLEHRGDAQSLALAHLMKSGT